jgi:hypothetical protein
MNFDIKKAITPALIIMSVLLLAFIGTQAHTIKDLKTQVAHYEAQKVFQDYSFNGHQRAANIATNQTSLSAYTYTDGSVQLLYIDDIEGKWYSIDAYPFSGEINYRITNASCAKEHDPMDYADHCTITYQGNMTRQD